MTTPLATGDDALALIPQKIPFVLVDTLLEATPSLFRSAFTVPSDHVLLNAARLSEAGLMENAAQTAALGMGKIAKDHGAPPPLGFIGALSKVEVHALPGVGDRIETTVDLRHEVMNARILEARIERGAELLAKLELKVFLMDQMP